jgi:hypothetical protein
MLVVSDMAVVSHMVVVSDMAVVLDMAVVSDTVEKVLADMEVLAIANLVNINDGELNYLV